jgi:alkanesulfonate monooxygenase SsuD/methylene tetrahydromethanopterin reductase-like flavin-dependent oxidoreductase (luciferase family)
MQYGIIISASNDPRVLAELAHEAEVAGWDGVFISDSISIETDTHPATPGFDPWVALAVMAMHTERVRLGTMVTAVTRRRPWKLARETVTLDHLSNGRLVLSVGLGPVYDDAGFYKVGEVLDRKVRAERTDETLAILNGLWSGRPFSFSGKHYQVQEMTLLPPPAQSPRIPIWVVGAWPRMKSMQRALRWDGLLPAIKNADGTWGDITPDSIRAMKAFVDGHRTATAPFDIVVEAVTPGDDRAKAAAIVRPFAEAGATWWIESTWMMPGEVEVQLARIRQGPPRLE